MSKRFALLVILLVLCLVVGACGAATPEPEPEPTTAPVADAPEPTATAVPEPEPTEAMPKKLVWGVTMGTNCLDPAFQTGLPDSNNIMNIYSNVITHKPGSLTEVAPDLAERWEVSDDGLAYTFYLREGVKWQKGYGELTAEDVKYSWDRMRDPETGARGASVFAPIESIEVVDPLTVRVNMKTPFAPFLINIAHSTGAHIVNQKAVEEGGDDYCLSPVGTGPYQVVTAETNGTVVLEVFEDYFGSRPAIDEVEMRVVPEESVAVLALKAGEIDYMIVREPANIADLRNAGDEIIVNADPNFSASTYALWLNNTREPFNDVRVRRALIHAIDRDTLAREATEGLVTKAANSVVPPSLVGYTDDVTKYEYDPEKAKALLAEAGYGDGVQITVDSMKTAFNPIMLTIVQQYWKEVGVDLEIGYLDRAAIRQHQGEGSYDITVSNPTRAEVDLIINYYRCDQFPPGQNMNLYKAPDEICELMDAQAQELDQAKRVEMLETIQKQISEDAPNVPLWYVSEVTAARSWVKGMIPNLAAWQTRFYLFDIEK
jgi:peptide/nickel transport system substrate-binding protein